MSPSPKTYLEKAGITKGTVYSILVVLSGGGLIEKNHGDSTTALQAQMAQAQTSIALVQQSNDILSKKVDQIDRDLRQLTRAVDRASSGKVASNP